MPACWSPRRCSSSSTRCFRAAGLQVVHSRGGRAGVPAHPARRRAWVRILFGLAWIPLDLVPTHPDRRAGISFLRLPSMGYCALLLFAVASTLCAEWGDRLALGASLSGFTPLLAL